MSSRARLTFVVDGREVTVPDDGSSLLAVLREQLGVTSAKDGCAPQGQCGCCTVLVDGAPRVACVTPARRVAGRTVTTIDGLDPARRDRWAGAFCAAGASQCGFCTPGIIVRLDATERSGGEVANALLAHQCRCTGWRTILDAYDAFAASEVDDAGFMFGFDAADGQGRDLAAAEARASLEGGVGQLVGPAVSLGQAGFADDLAPREVAVAVVGEGGEWVVGETLGQARGLANKVQGRHSTAPLHHPIPVPPGRWDVTLQTTWVDPGYLETDASWCEPGGVPASPLGNGGAFGAKLASPLPAAARALADRHGQPVRVVWSREDAIRFGPKRPPLAAGIDRANGRVAIAVARCPGIVARLTEALAGYDVTIDEVDIPGPPTSADLRAAGWAEGIALRAALLGGPAGRVTGAEGGWAEVTVGPEGSLVVVADAGDPLDATVLRSYCIGAAHMGLSWVSSEAIATAADGTPLDLTMRSLGILRGIDTPPIEVTIVESDGPPVAVSDLVFAATAAAVWAARGFPPTWPTDRG